MAPPFAEVSVNPAGLLFEASEVYTEAPAGVGDADEAIGVADTVRVLRAACSTTAVSGSHPRTGENSALGASEHRLRAEVCVVALLLRASMAGSRPSGWTAGTPCSQQGAQPE